MSTLAQNEKLVEDAKPPKDALILRVARQHHEDSRLPGNIHFEKEWDELNAEEQAHHVGAVRGLYELVRRDFEADMRQMRHALAGAARTLKHHGVDVMATAIENILSEQDAKVKQREV